MASTARHERDMIHKAKKDMNSAKDPIDKLRLHCLQRGVTGIRDFGRYLIFIFVSFCNATYLQLHIFPVLLS